ncbi:MAG TPA: hypothetical protein PKM56_01250 [Candidatus Rifleibacterium sp.]|nr:hypothetical protein [Candidatus Rifleibacterium sp.]
MTLKIPFRYFLPVLDAPAKRPGKKVFVTRRPISLAGKPLLAEKHLPVQPSFSLAARKCYATTVAALFKQAKSIARKTRFKPDFSFIKYEPLVFENARSGFFSTPGLPDPERWAGHIIEPATGLKHSGQSERLAISVDTNPHLAFTIADHPDPENILSGFLQRFSEPVMLPSPNEKIGLSGQETFIEPVTATPCPARLINLAIFESRKKFICRRPSLNQTFSFAGAEHNFTLFWPEVSFALAPANQKPLKDLTEPDYSLFRSQKFIGFGFFLKLDRAKNGPEREILANFLLESKIVFSPVCDNLIHSSIGTPHQSSCLQDSRGNLTPKFKSEASSIPLRGLPSYLPADIKISGARKATMSLCLPPARPANLCRTHARHGNFQIADHACRLKLRLKLRRMNPSAPDTRLKVMVPAVSLRPATRPTGFLQASYKEIRSKNPICKSFEHSDASIGRPPANDFHQKRSQFYIRAARHAQYTLRLLKNIFTANQHRASNQVMLNHMLTAMPELTSTAKKLRQPAAFNPFSTKLSLTASPASKIVSSTVALAERKLPLSLLAGRACFNDICTPEQPKKIATVTTQSANLHHETHAKRTRTLRMLRFKLHPVSTANLSYRNSPARSIGCARISAAIISRRAQKVNLPAGETMAIKLRDRQLQARHRLRLRKVALKIDLPGQIKPNMTLLLGIEGTDAPTTLCQKHFVYPSIWKRKQRSFNCRLSLLPHPFGFPDFCFSENVFSCLVKPVALTIPLPARQKAMLTGSFVIKREKIFLPPLSMKAPRRLLYSLSMPHELKEIFRAPRLITTTQLQPAPVIGSFTHTWLCNPNPRKISADTGMRMTRTRRHKSSSFVMPDRVIKSHTFLETAEAPSWLELPLIKRMLLRARRFATTRQSANFCPVNGPTSQRFLPAIALPAIAKPLQRLNLAGFSLFTPVARHFLHCWPLVDRLRCPVDDGNRMRLRSYRFPWHPEMPPTGQHSLSFSDRPSSNQTHSLDFADEVRAASFFFPWIDQISIASAYRNTDSAKGSKPVTTVLKEVNSAQATFLGRPIGIFAGMQLNIPSFNQFIDPANFFCCNEKPPAPMQKTRRHYSLKHATRRIQPENVILNYSEYSLQSAPGATLPMDPLHWIILMRSFISARPPALDYQFAATCATKTSSPTHGKPFNTSFPASFNHVGDAPLTGHLNQDAQQTMPLCLASLTANFYALPLRLTRSEIAAPEILDEKFAQLVHKAVFSAHHETGTLFELHRKSMLLPAATDHYTLATLACATHIPAFKISARRAPFIPDARLNLAPAGYKHASLPDWIDSHHERPGLNQ